MKKPIALILSLLLLLSLHPLQAAAARAPKLTMLLLQPGEVSQPVEGAGPWENTHPEIATIDDSGQVTAHEVGYTLIQSRNKKGEVTVRIEVKVGEKPVPAQIQAAIDQAIQAWAEADNAAFPKYNLYTQWYNPAAKSGFGWCGAFIGYYLEEAGIPMNPEYRAKSAPPLTDGSLFAVRQASQTKLFEGFQSRNRLSNIPQPGYYVVYGRRGSTPYTHVGLIAQVEYQGEGVYLLETVEGNLNSRIRRYRYLYDSLAQRKDRNVLSLPKDLRTEPETFLYEYVDQFYINVFGQTWY